MNHRIHIGAISPSIDGGSYPVKRVIGDELTISADILRDSHNRVRAQIRWREGSTPKSEWQPVSMTHKGNDRWHGTLLLTRSTTILFCVDAWTDDFGTWLAEMRRMVGTSWNISSVVGEGAELLSRAIDLATGGDHEYLAIALARLQAANTLLTALQAAEDPGLEDVVGYWTPRTDIVTSAMLQVKVDRQRAVFGNWYEMFPRSQGWEPGKPTGLRQAAERLPALRALGFHVVYLPPIHPIGYTRRKGPNNSLTAGPEDPGCPWAIGNAAGGHTEVDPGLGTVADFDAFVAATAQEGLEVALDFALQCSPDHPWVKEHPDWFYYRPDGSIKHAENLLKKYEDICALNFDTPDQDGLWQALLGVVTFWIQHRVKIFRVDNPHTKPFPFWSWLLAKVHENHPEVIFLSEAFTSPKVMKHLAKLGFTQSYTYFTWRNSAAELRDYLQELCYSGMQEYFRPIFFTNTPDILPWILQTGGVPAFKMRLVLAATLSPSYGIYSGFEICENTAVPNSEEYLNSEKYEIRVRDWNQVGNLCDLITRINQIRSENVAFQRLDNIQFFTSDCEDLLVYGKCLGDNVLLIVVNLDPHSSHQGLVYIPADFVGVVPGGRYNVIDLLTDAEYCWGECNYVRLDPHVQVAHILTVQHLT
ncbi:hypothetical protein DV736_g2058, partial [Chaetothyriales sp. CBS 134916]